MTLTEAMFLESIFFLALSGLLVLLKVKNSGMLFVIGAITLFASGMMAVLELIDYG